MFQGIELLSFPGQLSGYIYCLFLEVFIPPRICVPGLHSMAGVWPHSGLAAASVFLRAEVCGKAHCCPVPSAKMSGACVQKAEALEGFLCSVWEPSHHVACSLSLSPPDHIPSVALRVQCCRVKKKKKKCPTREL